MNQKILYFFVLLLAVNLQIVFTQNKFHLDSSNEIYQNAVASTVIIPVEIKKGISPSPPEKDISVGLKNYNTSIDSLKNTLGACSTAPEAHILCQIGSLHYRNFHFDKGLECAGKALKIGIPLKDTGVIIKALRLFADNYYAQANYEQSTNYFLQELEYHLNSGYERKIAEVYCNIGVNYEERGLLEKGMFYYLEALKLYEKIDDKEGIVASLCNLSYVYRNQSKNAEAIAALEKANAIEKQYLEIRKEHFYLANIADAFKNMGQYQKASEYLADAEKKLHSIPIPDDEDLMIWVDVTKTQADIYLQENKTDEAFKKYLEALAISRKTGYLEKEGNVVVALGIMCMKSGQYKKAVDYLNDGLEIAGETGSYYLKKDIYATLSEIAAIQKNYHQAWEFQKLFSEASDSVLNLESTRQLANFQAKYETEKKEGQIQLLRKEKEIQDLSLQKSENQKIYLSIMALLLVALSGIILNRYRLKKRIAAELLLLNATKDKFFTIIAHDLKNPVSAFNTIAQQVNTHLESLSPTDLKYYIAQLSNTSSELLTLLKNLLEWSRSQRGQLSPELKEVDLSLIAEKAIRELHTVASTKNIQVHTVDFTPLVILSDENILSTVLRNILGNAIKYSPEGGSIDVKTKTSQHDFIFTITDQGPGLTNDDIKRLFRIDVDTKTIGTPENKGTGIGLIICFEFLQKIGGRIWAESQPGQGCSFSISIPLKKHANQIVSKR